MAALQISLSTWPSSSPAGPAPRSLGRAAPAVVQSIGRRRGPEPGWPAGVSASLSSSSSGSGGDRSSRTPPVRSSLEIAGPTVGTVTEVGKDTFWPLVQAAGDKVVVLDMYTQWSLSKEEVKDISAKVENFLETQASETASLIGVSDAGVDKGLQSSLCLIKRRWLANIARKAKAEAASRKGETEQVVAPSSCLNVDEGFLLLILLG